MAVPTGSSTATVPLPLDLRKQHFTARGGYEEADVRTATAIATVSAQNQSLITRAAAETSPYAVDAGLGRYLRPAAASGGRCGMELTRFG